MVPEGVRPGPQPPILRIIHRDQEGVIISIILRQSQVEKSRRVRRNGRSRQRPAAAYLIFRLIGVGGQQTVCYAKEKLVGPKPYSAVEILVFLEFMAGCERCVAHMA